MTPTTVPVPVPYRKGDGGTVHKRPQGTVWGRFGDGSVGEVRSSDGGSFGNDGKRLSLLRRRDMVVLPPDKLLHWFGSGSTPQSMGPPGFGARLLTIVPSGNQQLPEDLGTHASVGEQVRREGRDDGSMISPSIAISSQGSRGCTKPGTLTRCASRRPGQRR